MLWLALIIGTTLSSKGFQELKKLNPFLSDLQIKTIESLTAALMLVVNRFGQLARCISDCAELLELLKKGSSKDAIELSSFIGKTTCVRNATTLPKTATGDIAMTQDFLFLSLCMILSYENLKWNWLKSSSEPLTTKTAVVTRC